MGSEDFDESTLVLQWVPRAPTPPLAWAWLAYVAVTYFSFKLGWWLGSLL